MTCLQKARMMNIKGIMKWPRKLISMLFSVKSKTWDGFVRRYRFEVKKPEDENSPDFYNYLL